MTPLTNQLAEALCGLSEWIRVNIGPDSPIAPHGLLKAADEALAEKARLTATRDRWQSNRIKEPAPWSIKNRRS